MKDIRNKSIILILTATGLLSILHYYTPLFETFRLRGEVFSDQIKQNNEDICGSFSSKEACNKENACTWCQAGAVPSKCYPTEQAKKLPHGVFKCDKVFFEDILEVTLSELSEAERLCDDVEQVAGYFRLGKSNKHYFYWFFESRDVPEDDPVVLWLTGGPGCSSSLALFAENGPCSVNDDLSLKSNPYSWNSNANLLYVDQPAGTGFSYGNHDRNEKQIGLDMNKFIRQFLQAFPKYKDNKFFVFGESYAGHYVPATAHAIFKQNALEKDRVNLRGMAIGNGLTDPEIQYRYYADMAYKSGTVPSRITYSEYERMVSVTPECIKLIQACNAENENDFFIFPTKEVPFFPMRSNVCMDAFNFCNDNLFESFSRTGYNQYDMRIKCEVPGLCYNFTAVEKLMNTNKMFEYLKIPGFIREKGWQSCDAGAYQDLMGDWMKNYQTLIPELLQDTEHPVAVLVYAGDVDYSVNYLGCRAWVNELEWQGKQAYNQEEWVQWRGAGSLRTFGGLSFLQVFRAGHMVPMDQPKIALEMLNEFTLNY
eukprot:augustus_masked-scaffold_3-processed-gene-11.41-mRNA-1 protein AED:0.34 eAED:0.35 QI:0/-1/0/1/-1/1/1/0/538